MGHLIEKYFHALSMANVFTLFTKGCKKSAPSIIEIVNSNLSRDDQSLYRNSVKMNIYLLCQIIELFIIEIHNANQVINEKGKGKKKKPLDSKIDMMEEIEIALHAMSQLFQSQINKFWDPPIVEDDFIKYGVFDLSYISMGYTRFCDLASF